MTVGRKLRGDFRPGDIVITGDGSWLSRCIMQMQRRPGEAQSVASHVGAMVSSTDVCEALSTVVIRPLTSRIEDSLCRLGWVEVWRPELTFEQQCTIENRLLSYAGRTYGWWKLVAHVADWALGGRYVVRRILKCDRYPICSWVVAYAFEPISTSYFGVAPESAQPDDIHDYMVEHPDAFRRIAEYRTA